jgi:hypothetical protein
LDVGKIAACLTGEVVQPSSSLATTGVHDGVAVQRLVNQYTQAA